MPKRIPLKIKKEVIKAIVRDEDTKIDIAKSNNISLQTLYKIQRENRDLFNKLVYEMKEKITAHALMKAEKALTKINNKNLNNSSAFQLSQISSTLMNINKQDNNNISVIVNNCPTDRQSLVNEILEAEVLTSDNTIVNGGSREIIPEPITNNDNNDCA